MVRNVILGLIGACFMFGLSDSAHAQEGGQIAQGSVSLDTVLVSPRRIPGLFVNTSEFPGSATVITASDIKESNATSAPELLSQFAGIGIMDSRGFGLGADSTVNLRGVVNSSRTGALVLLNGVRQNRITGDEVHWQAIPIDQIERIEIIRGGGSLIYGEGALSGLINIITKKGADAILETEETIEVGNFGQRHYALSARGQKGPITYGTSYGRKDVGGYRERMSSRTTTIMSHFGIDVLPQLHIEANALHSNDTTGFAGGITPEQSEADRRSMGSFPGFFDEEINQVSLDAIWHGQSGISLVGNIFMRRGESDSDTGSRFATITPSRGLSWRVNHEREFEALHHTLVGGIELLDEKANTGIRTSSYSESNKESYGLFIEETLRIKDRASLVGGLRFDKARFQEDISFPQFVGTLRFEGWSPRAGISFDVTDAISVYASYARPFKAPNVDDFSVAIPGGGFFSNIDLNPQQADDYELGLRVSDARLGTYEASWFYTQIDDEILFNDLPGNDQNQNFDTVRTGVELSLEPAIPIPDLKPKFTYTFLEAEFHKGSFKGNTLPAVPEHRFTTNITYRPTENLLMSLDWIWVNDFFRINDFNNILPGDNYGVLNLGIRYTLKDITMYFKVENATSEEYTSFQSSNGVTTSTGENPAPPVSYLLGMKVRF